MQIRLDGKVALVTGGSTGIGAAIALALAGAGARVALTYNRSHDEAEVLVRQIGASGGEAAALQADVTSASSVRKMAADVVDRFGRIDILVNNAGALVQRGAVHELPEEVWDEVMTVNLKSVYLVHREIAPTLIRQGGGCIVNNASISAFNGGGGGSVHYAASKAGVVALTRGLAKELAPHNIRVNAVAPGVIETPFHEKYSTPAMVQGWLDSIPMKRTGTAQETAGAVLYLCSPLAAYVTGQVIHVNGGQYLG